MNRTGGLVRFLSGNAPVSVQLLPRWLNITLVIRATRHKHRFLAIPRPVKRKPRVRLRMHRGLKLRFLPALAAVGGHVDLADCSPSGPGQTSNLDIPPAR